MPTFELDENQAAFQIRAFKPGSIQINDRILNESVIITPTQLIEHWQPQTITELSSASLDLIITLKPDILLIGTGSKMELLSAEIYGDLINHGIGVEIMDTSAACRTFNALSAENRNVVAALIIK
jgi:uncharacterized protein